MSIIRDDAVILKDGTLYCPSAEKTTVSKNVIKAYSSAYWSGYETVCLHANGTVTATGVIDYDTRGWRNIIDIIEYDGTLVGLKSDGTVVATGNNDYGQCDVSEWEDIIQIAACTTFGGYYTAGLRSDGTVVVMGDYEYLTKSVAKLKSVAHICIGGVGANGILIALRDDGKVRVAFPKESSNYDVYDVVDWENIVQVEYAGGYIIGLRNDGTVCYASNGKKGGKLP